MSYGFVIRLYINHLQGISRIAVKTICTLSEEQTGFDIPRYIIRNNGYILYYICNDDHKKLQYVFITLKNDPG